MKKDERGYIVVETIGSFILFVFLNISILSLINIVAVQARVHYALTQTAQTISMYSYTLELLGVAEPLKNIAKRTEDLTDQTNDLVGDVNNFLDSVEPIDQATRQDNIVDVIKTLSELDTDKVEQAGKELYDDVDKIAQQITDDPMDVLRNFMSAGISNGLSAGFGELARPLMNRYLQNGGVTGDRFLRAFHVVDGINGLDFYTLDSVGIDTEEGRLTGIETNDSFLLDSSGNLKLVVQYDVEYLFGALPLPFDDGVLHITQEVMTKAWLKGTGDGYKRASGTESGGG